MPTQRVPRSRTEVGGVVSQAEWTEDGPKYASLGELLADFAERAGFDEDMFDRSWLGQNRTLGHDFLHEDDMLPDPPARLAADLPPDDASSQD